MTLHSTYTTLKKHLKEKYSRQMTTDMGTTIQNKISCRAIPLTLLHQAIQEFKLNNAALLGISCRQAIIHMLYEDAALNIADLQQITPSLALTILDQRLSQIEIPEHSPFYEPYVNMGKWLIENQQWLAEYNADAQNLPELQWSDLPHELFDLTQGN